MWIFLLHFFFFFAADNCEYLKLYSIIGNVGQPLTGTRMQVNSDMSSPLESWEFVIHYIRPAVKMVTWYTHTEEDDLQNGEYCLHDEAHQTAQSIQVTVSEEKIDVMERLVP